jgi:hypothetical protein
MKKILTEAAAVGNATSRAIVFRSRLKDAYYYSRPISSFRPSTSEKELVVNADSSVDVWFGPTAPPGHESNWVQTVPGKGWNVLLRLYGPEQSWFDKTRESSNW